MECTVASNAPHCTSNGPKIHEYNASTMQSILENPELDRAACVLVKNNFVSAIHSNGYY